MPFNKQKFQISIIIIALLISIKSYPTVISYVSKEDLIKTSDFIALGQVVNTKTIYNHDKSLILTVSTIEVKNYIKGAQETTELNLVTPGGKIGDIGMKVHGIPALNKNERVVLFLRNENLNLTESFKNTVSLNGYGLGKYSIYYDQTENTEFVYNDLTGLSFYGSNGEFAKTKKHERLDSFLEEIQNHVRE